MKFNFNPTTTGNMLNGKFRSLVVVVIYIQSVISMPEISERHEDTQSVLERRESKEFKNIGCPSFKFSSCAELLAAGNIKSGVYTIYPRSWFRKDSFNVYCDMATDGGGWTVFQRRDDFEPREDFYRGWFDYRRGFGNLRKEFWLGNDYLYLLTNQDYVTLRVDMEDFEGYKRFALYKQFKISNWKDDFRVSIGKFSGDVGDSTGFNNYTFVTHDHGDLNNCSGRFKGGWWYTNCHSSNLNGLYLKGDHISYADGVNWYSWKAYNYSLKFTEMKVRPTHFLNCDDQ